MKDRRASQIGRRAMTRSAASGAAAASRSAPQQIAMELQESHGNAAAAKAVSRARMGAAGAAASAHRDAEGLSANEWDEALSYGAFDWVITDGEAHDVIAGISDLSGTEIQAAGTLLGPEKIARLWDNLTWLDKALYFSTVVKLVNNDDPQFLSDHQGNSDITMEDYSGEDQLFVGGVSPTDVIQSNINDCYLVSTLSSLAATNPTYIEGMIREDSPGVYSVRFYEKNAYGTYSPTWVQVTAQIATYGDKPVYGYSPDINDAGDREVWPSIIEKAYAKYSGDYDDIDFGDTYFAYEAIFGTPGTKNTTGAISEDQQWVDLNSALSNGDAVVTSTGTHVVSVLAVSDAGSTQEVLVRDQALATSSDDGTEWITWEEFRDRYDYFRHADSSTPS